MVAKEKRPSKEKKKGNSAKPRGKGLKEQLAETRETLQRVQAEFENSRKRLEKEKQEFVGVANAGLVKELLPLLDSVDAAEDHLEERRDMRKEEALAGIESIKKQLLAVLFSHGLQKIKALGRAFDPMLHECVMQACERGKPDGIVLQELQKGYMLNWKVLRHAKVKVNKL